jgi:hypothetical protein
MDALIIKVQQRVVGTRARLAEAFAVRGAAVCWQLAVLGLHFLCIPQDYDRHRVKKVTLAQGVRAINTSCGIELSAAEVDLLRSRYGTADGVDLRYQEFCDDVDSGALWRPLRVLSGLDIAHYYSMLLYHA